MKKMAATKYFIQQPSISFCSKNFIELVLKYQNFDCNVQAKIPDFLKLSQSQFSQHCGSLRMSTHQQKYVFCIGCICAVFDILTK
jgi:hypothetical protein